MIFGLPTRHLTVEIIFVLGLLYIPSVHRSYATITNKASNPRNVLLIGIETLRADHVGCLGYSRDTTPTLDLLAKEGALFTNCQATSSWTLPSVMSVLTSLYPGVHKTTHFDAALPKGRVTLAQIMQENGYSTAAIVGNPLLDHSNGFSCGFDLYDDYSLQLAANFNIFSDGGMPPQSGYDRHVLSSTNEVVNRTAIGWLKKHYQESFFLFVFFYDPHYDYVPPPPYDKLFDPNYEGAIDGRNIIKEPRKNKRPSTRDLDHIKALYDGEIRYTDAEIAKLIKALRAYDILDETLVVIFGDHGDEFYEHGSTGHGPSLHRELIHVPLILRYPPQIKAKVCSGDLVSLIDIMPTILDYTELKCSAAMQGMSLRPLIDNKKETLRDFVYAEREQGGLLQAVISKDHKLIVDLRRNTRQLYCLQNDPEERANLYPSSGYAALLDTQLDNWQSENERLVSELGAGEGSSLEINEQRLRQLKALGYAQ